MPASYCPHCGGPLERRLVPAEECERLVCQRCGRIHYENSKPCASALVIQDGKVLLVRRLLEPFRDHWDVPGGFLEAGEHPVDGVRRELAEETGLAIEPTEILGIYMDTYGPVGEPTLNIYYLAHIIGGTLAPGSDASEAAWFEPDELPERIAFSCNRLALSEWQGRVRQAAP